MSRRLIALAASCSMLLGAYSTNWSRAQDAAAPEVANSKFQFTGTVNANAVYVRSGPGENYYPTMKLDKGAAVTVVGIKFEWLKILPPEGSFSYVAKAYVEKRGDGSVGRATKPDLNVRAGSGLNPMKTTVQTKLSADQDVKILGEQDEYFKIAPPEGAFVYVNKQFIDPGQPLVATAVPKKVEEEPIPSAPVMPVSHEAAPSTQPVKTVAIDTAGPTNGNPTNPEHPTAPAVAPSTQPVAKLPADQQFDKLETEFVAASAKSIADQPLDTLKAGYEAVLTDETLPVSMRRLGENRVATIKLRAEAQAQFLAARKDLADSETRRKSQTEEAKELQNLINTNKVTVYAALGTLRTSSLQAGVGTLYRLTDPTSGRTLVYVRSVDPKINSLMNQFVGLKGEVITDPQLNIKSIAPTAIEAVEIGKVNNGVTATILPASLLPQVSTNR